MRFGKKLVSKPSKNRLAAVVPMSSEPSIRVPVALGEEVPLVEFKRGGRSVLGTLRLELNDEGGLNFVIQIDPEIRKDISPDACYTIAIGPVVDTPEGILRPYEAGYIPPPPHEGE